LSADPAPRSLLVARAHPAHLPTRTATRRLAEAIPLVVNHRGSPRGPPTDRDHQLNELDPRSAARARSFISRRRRRKRSRPDWVRSSAVRGPRKQQQSAPLLDMTESSAEDPTQKDS
jgi:hypothetical protein